MQIQGVIHDDRQVRFKNDGMDPSISHIDACNTDPKQMEKIWNDCPDAEVHQATLFLVRSVGSMNPDNNASSVCRLNDGKCNNGGSTGSDRRTGRSDL